MEFKVLIGNMMNARKLSNIASKYDVNIDIICNRYILDAKSILGLLSFSAYNIGILKIHTEDKSIIDNIKIDLSTSNLLLDNLDIIHKSYDISAFGELLIDFTMIESTNSQNKLFEQNPGGAPANLLSCANNLGSKTAFIGKVGNDMHGLFLKSTLEDVNIDTKGLIVDDNHFTTLAFVALDSNGERSFSFARKPGADTMLETSEVDFDIIKNSRIFHVGSLSLTNNPSRQTTFDTLNFAKENNLIVSYDPNYRASLWKDEETAKEYMRKIIPFADIMKISDEEMELLTDFNTPEEAAKHLCDAGVKIVVITLGEKGAYVSNKETGTYVSGFTPKEVVDTTGAGDSFFGAFLSEILKTNKSFYDLSIDELSSITTVANAAASLCIEKRGAIKAMPTYEEINLRVLNK